VLFKEKAEGVRKGNRRAAVSYVHQHVVRYSGAKKLRDVENVHQYCRANDGKGERDCIEEEEGKVVNADIDARH